MFEFEKRDYLKAMSPQRYEEAEKEAEILSKSYMEGLPVFELRPDGVIRVVDKTYLGGFSNYYITEVFKDLDDLGWFNNLVRSVKIKIYEWKHGKVKPFRFEYVHGNIYTQAMSPAAAKEIFIKRIGDETIKEHKSQKETIKRDRRSKSKRKKSKRK